MSVAIQYFKALSDETRVRLLCILRQHELSVNELVTILAMGQSRVSRHLKILAAAGLLHSRRDGLWVFYSAVSVGPAFEFMEAVFPFITAHSDLRADMDMAWRIIDERTLKTRQFFNAIAEDWDALNREVLGGFDLATAVCAAMPPHCALAVDLGCGTGSVLERMLERAQGVIGVDGSSRMLEMARHRFAPEYMGDEGRVSLRIGELDHLPLRDAEANFACINLVLHHLSAPTVAMDEIHRILAPAGLVLVTDFDKHDVERMRSEYGDRWLGFDADALSTLLEDSHFRVCHIQRHPVEKGLTLLLVLAEKIIP